MPYYVAKTLSLNPDQTVGRQVANLSRPSLQYEEHLLVLLLLPFLISSCQVPHNTLLTRYLTLSTTHVQPQKYLTILMGQCSVLSWSPLHGAYGHGATTHLLVTTNHQEYYHTPSLQYQQEFTKL